MHALKHFQFSLNVGTALSILRASCSAKPLRTFRNAHYALIRALHIIRQDRWRITYRCDRQAVAGILIGEAAIAEASS